MDKKDFEIVAINPEQLLTIDRQVLEEETYDTLVQMGISASETKTYAQWILGKLGSVVSKKSVGSLEQYSKQIRQNYNSMRNYVAIYTKFINEDPDFTPSKYAGSIPWGVLALVASSSDTPQKRIEELRDSGAEVSMDSAYRHTKEKETGQKIPPKPKISLHWDSLEEKYTIFIKQNDFPLINWKDIKQQLSDYLESLE